MRMSECLLTVLLIAPWIAVTQAGQPMPAEPDDSAISVADVLDRVERAGRISAESVELWKQGLDSMDHPVASLEIALLEIYGPAPVRDPARGLERLGSLQADNSGQLPPETLRLLAVLANHVGQRMELEQQLQLVAAQLERERRAHLSTLEKLDALRQIERQLESQQSESAQPDREH